MTLNEAHRSARNASRREAGEFFVVREDGYHVADAIDLDTFFAGLYEQDIIAVYVGGEVAS